MSFSKLFSVLLTIFLFISNNIIGQTQEDINQLINNLETAIINEELYEIVRLWVEIRVAYSYNSDPFVYKDLSPDIYAKVENSIIKLSKEQVDDLITWFEDADNRLQEFDRSILEDENREHYKSFLLFQILYTISFITLDNLIQQEEENKYWSEDIHKLYQALKIDEKIKQKNSFRYQYFADKYYSK